MKKKWKPSFIWGFTDGFVSALVFFILLSIFGSIVGISTLELALILVLSGVATGIMNVVIPQK
jgi:hypothetical protein